jgi:hypothetical protein
MSRRDHQNLFTACFSPAFLALAAANPNRAPIGVFIGLGVLFVIVAIVLYFAVPVSGEDLLYHGTKYYSGPFGGLGGFGNYGPFGGYPRSGSHLWKDDDD